MGVRKRLSEESLRDTYRLNGVATGSAIARCYDKYGRWEYGYTVGILLRKTASVVQIRWADEPEEIKQYTQGDARYEVDRGRWRILGLVQGNPLDANDPIAVALTGLMGSGIIEASANDADSTDRGDEEMAQRKSHAATEREAAQNALKNGELKERDNLTAKQVATRCGTDAKTMRKFFRSSHSTVEAVGQGGRYEFAAADFSKIKREFDAWTARSQSKAKPAPKKPLTEVHTKAEIAEGLTEDPDMTDPWQSARSDAQDHLAGLGEDREPTDEEIEAMAALDLDIDDLDGEDI